MLKKTINEGASGPFFYNKKELILEIPNFSKINCNE